MTEKNPGKIALALSLPVSVLLIIASYFGVFIENTYSRETLTLATQGIGQDIVNLFIISPLLLITSFLAYKKSKAAMLIWSGAIFYLIYSYAIYTFAIHFNSLFIVYCFILGLSFYSFMYFILSQIKEPVIDWDSSNIPIKTVSVFLIVIAILFYFLWLSEIIPALIKNEIPKSITENGLLTNPVHVLDLSVVLPGLLITAIFLSNKKSLGFLLAPAMLMFCILMSLAIDGMVIAMRMKGIESDVSLTIIFGFITLMSTIILVTFLKSIKKKE
ncbi:MAG: hypothetical protein GYA35_06175 [Thermoanaerobaculaceae bacterium]|nr:hypothetical protein [Thermoanaerobaculaceae bacterium]